MFHNRTRQIGGLALAGAIALLLVTTPAWAGQLAKARQLINEERYQDAITLLEDFAHKFPSEPRVWGLLARCYENTFPPRISDQDHALEAQNRAENSRTTIFTTMKDAEASTTYLKLVKDEPEDPQNNLLLAIAYLQNDKDYPAARKQLERVRELGVPDELTQPYHNAWGLYWMVVKNLEAARDEFKVAKRGLTNSFALSKLQEIDALEAATQQSIEVENNDPNKLNAKRFNELLAGARQLSRDGQNASAVDLLEAALQLNPDSADTQALLAKIKLTAAGELYHAGRGLMDDKKYVEAYEKFDKAVQFDPANASASLALDFVKQKLAEMDRPQVIRRIIPASGSLAPSPSP